MGQKKKSVVQQPLGYNTTSQIARFKQNATHVSNSGSQLSVKKKPTIAISTYSKSNVNKQMAKSMMDKQQELGEPASPSRNQTAIGANLGLRSLDQGQAPGESQGLSAGDTHPYFESIVLKALPLQTKTQESDRNS